LVCAFALIVKLYVVHSFFVENLEEVPHRGSTKSRIRLAAYRDNESGVLVAKLYESREDGIRLPGSRPSLMDLDTCL
jgi:hypothetical protein